MSIALALGLLGWTWQALIVNASSGLEDYE
jgi:hypothetical protein